MAVLTAVWTACWSVVRTTRLRAMVVHDTALSSCMLAVATVTYGLPWGVLILPITDVIWVIFRLCSSRADSAVPFKLSSYLTVNTDSLQIHVGIVFYGSIFQAVIRI